MTPSTRWQRGCFLSCSAADAALVVPPRLALAPNPLKVGPMLPPTEPFAPRGRQIEAACRVYIKRSGPGSMRRATAGARR